MMQYFSSMMTIFATVSMLFFGYAAHQYFTYSNLHWLSIIGGSIFLIISVYVEYRRQKEVADEEREWRKKRDERN